jgi:hypothetical protein
MLVRYVAPPMTHSTLDYATPRRKPVRLWHVAVWLLPAWCSLMTFGVFTIVGREIDMLWWLAMLLPVALGTGCCAVGHYKLMWYSFAVALAVLATTIVLPSINRAT